MAHFEEEYFQLSSFKFTIFLISAHNKKKTIKAFPESTKMAYTPIGRHSKLHLTGRRLKVIDSIQREIATQFLVLVQHNLAGKAV